MSEQAPKGKNVAWSALLGAWPGEQDAVDVVLYAASGYGYGNMIAHLRREWAEKLVLDHGLEPRLAIGAANTEPYPLRLTPNVF